MFNRRMSKKLLLVKIKNIFFSKTLFFSYFFSFFRKHFYLICAGLCFKIFKIFFRLAFLYTSTIFVSVIILFMHFVCIQSHIFSKHQITELLAISISAIPISTITINKSIMSSTIVKATILFSTITTINFNGSIRIKSSTIFSNFCTIYSPTAT